MEVKAFSIPAKFTKFTKPKTDTTETTDETTTEDEQQNDWSKIQLDKINESCIKHKKKLFSSENYIIYRGKMEIIDKSGNVNVKKVNIIETSVCPTIKFIKVIELLQNIKHEYLEQVIGYANTSKHNSIISLRVGRKLSSILSKAQTNKNHKIYKNCNRTKLSFKIALVMSYLHSLNIIHRDLSSINITVDKNYEPHISNFINSRILPEDLNLDKLSKNPYCAYGIRPPELIEVENYDQTIDVFHFGFLLYELLLTENKLFDGKSSDEIDEILMSNDLLETIANDNLPKETSEDLKELIFKCWSQYKEQRPSFNEIVCIMSTKKIKFPNDSNKKVKEFYESVSIKNIFLEKCINIINGIKVSCNYSTEFKNEILRVKLLLNTYQYELQNSDYAKQTYIEQENFQSLKESLEELQCVIDSTSKEKWNDYYKKNSVILISTNIYKLMDKIFELMTKLGFGVKKYEYSNNDLILDLSTIYSKFKLYLSDKNSSIYQLRMGEIQVFLKSKKLDIGITKKVFNKQLKTSLKNINIIKDASKYYKILSEVPIGEGQTSIVYKGIKITPESKSPDTITELFDSTDTNTKSSESIVAIKKLKDDCFDVTYLKREIKNLAKLNHKNLINFIAFDIKKLWIVTKYITEGSLYYAIFPKKKKC